MKRSCRWPRECGEQRLRGSTRLARGARSLSWVPGSSLQDVPVVSIQPDALLGTTSGDGSNRRDCRATSCRSSILIGSRVYVRPPRSVTIIAGFVSACQTLWTPKLTMSGGFPRTFAGKRISWSWTVSGGQRNDFPAARRIPLRNEFHLRHLPLNLTIIDNVSGKLLTIHG